jgi:transposase InsO family protein
MHCRLKKNPYRVPFALREEMRKQLDDMIQKGVITPAFSEWAAPVILVHKKAMDGTPKYRFCTDVRGLNAVTKIPVYPIPDIKSNLSLMAGSRYFTLLDIESAYSHIPIHPDDKSKTGFVTPFGSFCYKRLAYGLAGAPSTFQKIMDITLMGLKDISALVYLDDILIFSDTIQEYGKRIKNVFDRIREANFKLNLGKCTFAAREVAYLGHIVSADWIMVDQGKVKAIRQFPLPRTVRDIRAFLGLAGYYRSFIKDFANLSKPLTLLTRKVTKFYWLDLQQKAFDALKAALTSESVLAHPEFDKPFILSCDASNYAISAILSQDHNGKERPLSFASRILNQHEINYSTTEKELLAVVFGVRTHRCFLYGRKFKIITDHAALKWLITVKNHQCARLNRWVLKLAEYDFDIQHRPGKKHVNADVLSRHVATVVRKHEDSQETEEDTAEPPLTKEQIGQAQKEDEYCKQIVKALTAGENLSYYLDQDSVLYYGKPDEKDRGDLRIVIPVTYREQVIRQHHDPVFAGHQGLKRKQNYLKTRYFWPTLMKDVEEYIQKCESCATMKGGRNPLAPLGELPETTEPMQITSIDICGPYSVTSRNNKYLLTFIDHFLRYPEAIPIPSQDTGTVAKALVTQVFTRHGCRQVLSSDRGTNFMSSLFQEMCKLMHIKKINSTSFNPKMQGKVEKFHAGLNQTMSHYVNKYGNNWDDLVDYALMVHRAMPHTITKFSPFYLLYGREMRLPTTNDLNACLSSGTKDVNSGDPIDIHIRTLAERLTEAYKTVEEHNRVGRAKQKIQYDKNTKLVTFSVGDYIYLKEMAIGPGKSKKFRGRWRGPFEVIKRLSDWNYQIRMKPGKDVVVNVNRMKLCRSSPTRKRTTGRLISGSKIKLTEPKTVEQDIETPPVSGRPIIVTETQIPREQRDEIILDEGPEDLDDSRRDPTWRPGHAVHGQRETEVQDTEGELRGPSRYYLRSSDKADSEASASIEPQTIELPREEQSLQFPIDFPTDEGNAVRDEGGSQPPPYPYSLRRLPGRRN